MRLIEKIFRNKITKVNFFFKAWRLEARRPVTEREWRQRRGRAARKGRRAPQGGHLQRQACRQVSLSL